MFSQDAPMMGPLFSPQVQRSRDYQRTREMSIGSLLMENRIIFLGAYDRNPYPDINDQTANVIIQQLLYLQYENTSQPIHMYINCPGGSVTATLAIYDTMQFLECPIATYCMGLAASGAALILAAGSKGKRYALPHSRIMMHQPWGQVGYGQVSDLEIEAREMLKTRKVLDEIIARHTGQPIEVVNRETERDRYFSPEEAKEFNIIDQVLSRQSEAK
ncbi:MAG: ATP-dependent Clp protease proteolytic subunit [Zavarzinella sp.]